ncbi:MAG: hypothetical protein PF439_11655, partial [Helicobacteraceae bacterium]|nr:hypothetical protein [Helicobacteraceae bacterium]
QKKDGKILTWEALFKAAGEGQYFWLDYKNLEHLTAAETKEAIKRLLFITEEGSIRERLYIEASNPLALSKYTDAGFKTILGIHPLPEQNLAASIVINAYKIGYYFNNITALAMAYGSVENPIYGHNTEKSLASIPVFLFHVPDNVSLLQDLADKSNVKVILAGRDKSINRFQINNCKE